MSKSDRQDKQTIGGVQDFLESDGSDG